MSYSRGYLMHRAILLAILMASASLTGCISDEDTLPAEAELDNGNDFRPYSVIAPIDTGINPYHNLSLIHI
mgnify:FL=1